MPGATSSANFSCPCSPEESSSTFSYCRSRSRRKLREEAGRTSVYSHLSNVLLDPVSSGWPAGSSQQPQARRHAFVAQFQGWGPNVDPQEPHHPQTFPLPPTVSHLLSRDTFSNFLCAFLSSSWKHSCSYITGKVDAEPTAIRKGARNPATADSAPFTRG